MISCVVFILHKKTPNTCCKIGGRSLFVVLLLLCFFFFFFFFGGGGEISFLYQFDMCVLDFVSSDIHRSVKGLLCV